MAANRSEAGVYYTPDDPAAGGPGGQDQAYADYAATAPTEAGTPMADAGAGVGATQDQTTGVAVTPAEQAQRADWRVGGGVKIIGQRIVTLAPGVPYVGQVRATSVKIIRTSDPTAEITFRFDNSQRVTVDPGSFFAPGGTFSLIDVESDKPVTMTLQFGAQFSS